ncbi:MAG: helix-turn-helix transcriptional regulator [Bifidobacterium bifidum]|nr:helix-turn-helix transcriptional regulator [Bifidobacterium bifidum]
MDIRTKIRRERLGLSQKRFAELEGVDVSSVRRWENSPNGVAPERVSQDLDALIEDQERQAKRTLDYYAEETRSIVALIWPDQREMDRQYGHKTSRNFERDNADTMYFAQLLEHEGHIIDYKSAPVLGEDGKPDPLYEQDGSTLFVPDGEPGLNRQSRQALERLLANNASELQHLVGKMGEHAYSSVAMPMELYGLVQKWSEEIRPKNGYLSSYLASTLIWSFIRREAEYQWKYAVCGCFGYEDTESTMLATGLSEEELKAIDDDPENHCTPKKFTLR